MQHGKTSAGGTIMKVKSVRIPEDIDKAVDYVARSEKLEKTQSIRKLTRLGFEVYVAKSYEKGKLTLREAATLLNLTLSETIDLLSEMGVKGNIRAKDTMESLKLML
jgi:predicted HTH domain antitoxin